MLTRLVIDEALRTTAPWIVQKLIHAVAVNLSPLDLLDPQLPNFVKERLAAHCLTGDRLILEINE